MPRTPNLRTSSGPSAQEPRFLQPWQRALLWSLGGISFIAGTTAVFVTENGSGSLALLVFSGLTLAVAVLGDRIERFEFGGATLRLRAAAADRYAQAEQAEEDGDGPGAAQLRDEARTLFDAAGSLLTDYRSTRATMPSGTARVRALERIMSRARHLATTQTFASHEVRKWLRSGNDEERVTALGLMQADASLRDFDTLLAVLTQPRSAFEHYHAMVLAEQMLTDLDAEQRRDLTAALQTERVQNLRPTSDRRVLGDSILRTLTQSN